MAVKYILSLDNSYMAINICIRLGENIRALRIKRKLTQEELADKAGISTKYLQNLESKNPKNASVVTLEKLAKGLGIPIWEILKIKD
jgi:XRE family aerobic/anaerobic benzoate catabolism transcriptional regulator